MPNTSDHVLDQSKSPKATLEAIAGRPIAGQPPTLIASNVVALRKRGPAGLASLPLPGDGKEGAQQRPEQLVTISGLCAQSRAGTPPTVADQRWFAELTTLWVRGGCPADLRISFSLRDAAEVLGGSAGGGGQLELVRASLLRLRSATLESAGREESTICGLLERAGIVQPRTGLASGWAEFNRHVAELLQEGSVTHLHAPTWDHLRHRDELAARLWLFLEGEEMPTLGRRYNLFSALPGEVPKPRSVPAVSELLGLEERPIRRLTVDRIRRAIRALEDLDARYAAEVVRSAQAGMWRLEVRRRHLVPSWPERGCP